MFLQHREMYACISVRRIETELETNSRIQEPCKIFINACDGDALWSVDADKLFRLKKIERQPANVPRARRRSFTLADNIFHIPIATLVSADCSPPPTACRCDIFPNLSSLSKA